jgi:hypothetical protein
MVYNGIPNKRRRIYSDSNGRLLPLDKRSGNAYWYSVASSGTLISDGHLTVTGTEFKVDSVITPSYRGGSAGTLPMAVDPAAGSATFYGDANAVFYYTVVNFVA